MAISKIILNGVTQMDVTDTTAEAEADGTSPTMAPKDVSTVYTGSVTGEVEFTA